MTSIATPAVVVQLLPLERVALDVVARDRLARGVVAEYASRMQAGRAFPPVLVVFDGVRHLLVDGAHRVAACRQLGRRHVLAEIRRGSIEDAVWEACATNKAHGLRRSNADKRRSVERALRHVRGSRLSDRQVGAHCGVHHHTVGRIRAELVQSGALHAAHERVVQRAGLCYVLDVRSVATSNRVRVRIEPRSGPGAASAAISAITDPQLECVRTHLAHALASLQAARHDGLCATRAARRANAARDIERSLEDLRRAAKQLIERFDRDVDHVRAAGAVGHGLA